MAAVYTLKSFLTPYYFVQKVLTVHFAPPASGYAAVVGAVFFRCPPGKTSLQELALQFLASPPGTHGFAGGSLPLVAGSSG